MNIERPAPFARPSATRVDSPRPVTLGPSVILPDERRQVWPPSVEIVAYELHGATSVLLSAMTTAGNAAQEPGICTGGEKVIPSSVERVDQAPGALLADLKNVSRTVPSARTVAAG
eukprot:COSAG02_NODE_9843_length_2095_cov_2.946673_3_plen_116_part_00